MSPENGDPSVSRLVRLKNARNRVSIRLLRTSDGIEMAVANACHLWEPGVDAEQTVLATAGDRLALQHWRFTGREVDVLLWERESLTVAEVDAKGRMIFDLTDTDRALACFAELSVEGPAS